jgi:hypothetical protein
LDSVCTSLESTIAQIEQEQQKSLRNKLYVNVVPPLPLRPIRIASHDNYDDPFCPGCTPPGEPKPKPFSRKRLDSVSSTRSFKSLGSSCSLARTPSVKRSIREFAYDPITIEMHLHELPMLESVVKAHPHYKIEEGRYAGVTIYTAMRLAGDEKLEEIEKILQEMQFGVNIQLVAGMFAAIPAPKD